MIVRYSGAYDFMLVRLTPSGEVDTDFNTTGFRITDFGSTIHARANALAINSTTGAITGRAPQRACAGDSRRGPH